MQPANVATRRESGHEAATASVLAPTNRTIIIGAGIAGLACARRLRDAGHPFQVISKDVGGRIERSPDGTLNLGAYYVRSDYSHVNQYVQLGRRLDRLAVQRHDAGNGFYRYWDRRLLLHMPQAARFLRLLVDFRRRYNKLKQSTIAAGQADAIRADAALHDLYRQPALDFVLEHRLDELAKLYIEPGIHGTTFTGLREITAFTMLLGALPILVPAYEFTPRLDRLTAGLKDRILADSVTAISAHPGGYRITTEAHGTTVATHVVVATPTAVAKKLLGLRSTKGSIDAHMFQVAGVLRHPYSRADINLFPAGDHTLAIARQAGGAVLLCSRLRSPDFGRYFAAWRVVAHRHWDPAFHLVGGDLLETEQERNLYLVGDHNIVGLEDAYLTGVHAADRMVAVESRKPATEGALAPSVR